MRRRLFAVVSAGSLLVCLASVVLWVRSYDHADGVGYHALDPRSRELDEYEIWIEHGGVSFSYDRYELDTPEGFEHFIANPIHRQGLRHSTARTPQYGPRFWMRHLTGGFEHWTLYPGKIRVWKDDIEVPIWVVAVAFLLPVVPPAIGLARRRFRSRAIGCSICGYNLTGNTSGVCPECGTPVAGKVEAKA